MEIITNPLEAMGEEGGRSRVQRRGGDVGDAVEWEASMHRNLTLGATKEATSSNSGDGLKGKERSKRRQGPACAQRKQRKGGAKAGCWGSYGCGGDIHLT